MDHDFWLDKWRRDEIGFHEVETHPLLIQYWQTLTESRGGRVFAPLCGKSNDLLWLRDQGHEVCGIELSQIAVEAFFSDNGLAYSRAPDGGLTRFEGDRVTLWCGDFFDLDANHLSDVRWFYDRAALIALPPEVRSRYVIRLHELLTNDVIGLLITISYTAGLFSPPPFAVEPAEVVRHCADVFEVRTLGESPARAKGHDCLEYVFALQRLCSNAAMQ